MNRQLIWIDNDLADFWFIWDYCEDKGIEIISCKSVEEGIGVLSGTIGGAERRHSCVLLDAVLPLGMESTRILNECGCSQQQLDAMDPRVTGHFIFAHPSVIGEWKKQTVVLSVHPKSQLASCFGAVSEFIQKDELTSRDGRKQFLAIIARILEVTI